METMVWKREVPGGVAVYRAVDVDQDELLIREGAIGEPGTTRRRPLDPNLGVVENVEAEIAAASEEGFMDADEFGEELVKLVIPIDARGVPGTPSEPVAPIALEAAERFADRLGAALATGGIGTCDGIEINADSAVLHCFVVDAGAAEREMERLLADSPFEEGAFIAEEDGDRPGNPRN